MASTYPSNPNQQPIIINNNTEPPLPPQPENVTIINNQVHPEVPAVPVTQPIYGQPVHGAPIDPHGFHAKRVQFCHRCQQNRWVYEDPKYTPGTILCCILCPIIGWIVCLTDALCGMKIKCTVCHSKL